MLLDKVFSGFKIDEAMNFYEAGRLGGLGIFPHTKNINLLNFFSFTLYQRGFYFDEKDVSGLNWKDTDWS